MSSPTSAAPVGRPRSGARRLPAATAREEILDAAAELFASRGYAATSTRLIAERVGIRQASLYYHFANKEQILAELLESTVRPSLTFAASLSARSPADALHTLVHYDVGVLLAAPWNIGILYALPEIASEPFAQFRREREALRAVYRSLTAAAGGSALTGEFIFGLAENVIGMRRDLSTLPPADALQDAVADAALRLLGAA
ncbi:transcriptional regulator AmtR [Paractinoplanes ferrugineus]|uniref:TetR family transcriptional regulator n=1 Tax=Paractinoplanes ferrugineus TaxID=113564 RepID=A0A919J5F3_9ACTN|nr:TetR/AcrR family transcriptional regulator [Actinoplanes ferrugineus]GIE13687.1 TetR family transcriptional regulator [Actinoplanes ferrugineus]